MDEEDIGKIIIVTQTPAYQRKHPGGDRTTNFTSRPKITSDLAQAINDGLYFYEQDLYSDVDTYKVCQNFVSVLYGNVFLQEKPRNKVDVISQEEFDSQRGVETESDLVFSLETEETTPTQPAEVPTTPKTPSQSNKEKNLARFYPVPFKQDTPSKVCR